jgi:hypothetical protein
MAKKTFVLHDESVNTRGFRMLTAGADLREFIKNPVGLLNHKDWDMPIIRWENIRVAGATILADAVFDEGDPKAIEVMGKVDRDFIRMASIGSWPPEEISYDEALMLPGQLLPTITKWTVREASIVTIGSNHNAMVFYDRATGDQIDLSDPNELIKLMDNKSVKRKNRKMDELNQILKLADTATDADRTAAIGAIIANVSRLTTDNVALASRIDELNNSAKAKQKADAIVLIDAAVLDGRLNAIGKDNYVKLFDLDFDSAKATLEAIPARGSVSKQIEAGKETASVELADFANQTWDQIDKAGKLLQLKDKAPDLYAQKFETRFGIKPKQ